MAIYGAVAYRANKLRMENGQLIVTSPSFTGFEWPAVPVVWAECSKCPTDEDGHIMSEKDCTCGIYSAYCIETVSYYVHGENFVPVLVEALGHYWFHWDDDTKYKRGNISVSSNTQSDPRRGLTSAGAQVIAVVKDFRPDKFSKFYPEMWIGALAAHYNVPLITLEAADELIEWAWERFMPNEEKELEGQLLEL